VNSVNQSVTHTLLNANRKLTLFTLVALPVLISLGLWQLDRATQKRALEAAYLDQQAQPPSALNSANLAQLMDYRRVVLQGQFDRDHTWLLDNKQRYGQVGYEVVMPFILAEGGMILVNRGWLAGTGQRDTLPDIPDAIGDMMLFGELMSVTKHPLLDASSPSDRWPRIILAIEPKTMIKQLGHTLPERYVRLDDASPGALITDWQTVTVSAAKHLGYAFQWFAMAVALLLWFVVANTKVMQTWRRSQP
jgi:cytochrome oxidase assembly protein ShyY1